MSSSNLVRITTIKESTLGETPVAGNFDTVRFTGESLSGTPTTTESQQIRSDRLSSGQIAVGLEVGGEINFELAKDEVVEMYMESAMLNEWDVQALQTEDLDINAVSFQITRAAGDWNTTVSVGDILTLAGFVNSANNTQVQVVEVISATVIRCVFKGTPVTEVGSGTTYQRADKLSIGTGKIPLVIEKAFLDLTTKALIYNGMHVGSMELNIAHGEIVTGTFGFSGTKYTIASIAAEFATDGRTINPASTTQALNGSIDMPFVNTSVGGTFSKSDFCIQSANISLNNNFQPENCIGQAAPEDYSPGQATIETNISAYLSDETWTLLGKKLTQEAFALGFMVQNAGGFYGFYMPAIQATFSDPSSAGPNEIISVELAGQAKVGPNGESSLFIYRG